MASRQQEVLLFAIAAVVVAVACLPAPAAAVEWMVGDDAGWRGQFNKTGWTDGKTFTVGDTLRFMYTQGQHTVIEVGGADFKACNLQGNQLGSWNSGNDVVTLDKPGKRWFLCDKPNHCNLGMKMVINVVAAAPAPDQPPQSSAPFSVVGGAAATVAAAGAAVVAAALAL